MLLSDESLKAMSEIITVQKKDSKTYWNWWTLVETVGVMKLSRK
jgi:hypothetical protein